MKAQRFQQWRHNNNNFGSHLNDDCVWEKSPKLDVQNNRLSEPFFAESIRYKTEELNATLTTGLNRQLVTQQRHVKTQLSGLMANVLENRNELKSARNNEGIRRLSSDYNDLKRQIEATLPRLLSDVTRNNSFLSTRWTTRIKKKSSI